jgi:hypothetical protein
MLARSGGPAKAPVPKEILRDRNTTLGPHHHRRLLHFASRQAAPSVIASRRAVADGALGRLVSWLALAPISSTPGGSTGALLLDVGGSIHRGVDSPLLRVGGRVGSSRPVRDSPGAADAMDHTIQAGTTSGD